MSNAPLDQNSRQGLTALSSSDGTTIVALYADPITHRLLVDFATAGGTVTSVSVVTANGFAGTVANATTTPAITLTTTLTTPVIAGNGTALIAATTTGSGSTVVLATAPTFPTSITVGAASGATGTILLKGTTSGTVTLSTADAAGTWTMKLPTTDGNNLEFLQTDGSGNTTWASVNTIPATTITVSNEATDTTCFPVFVTAATGDLGPKSNAGLTFNSNTSSLGATLMVATTSVTSASILASSNDSGALGAAATAFSDLFLASGALIGFANGNAVITHSSGVLTISTGELRITTVGTDTASVPTLGSTSTLTNKTLTSPTINTATLGGAQQLAEGASIRLDASLSATGTYSGMTIAGTAGATLAFGDLIYLAAADSRWELTDSDSVTTAGPVWIGMCVLAAAADGDPTVVLLQGNIRASVFPTLTVSAPAYVGTSAGDVQVAAPTGDNDVVRIVGHAITADVLYFNPSTDWVVLVV